MCVEAMDTRPKSLKTGCLRKTMKPGSKSWSKLRWRNLGATFVEEEEALKQGRPKTMNAIMRKYLRREQKRIQLAKIVDREEARYEAAESLAMAVRTRHSPGAMAPANTTQYLMARFYEDMRDVNGNHRSVLSVPSESCADLYGESLSPPSVYDALDCGYESCLAFQQRDFEEVFGLGV